MDLLMRDRFGPGDYLLAVPSRIMAATNLNLPRSLDNTACVFAPKPNFELLAFG